MILNRKFVFAFAIGVVAASICALAFIGTGNADENSTIADGTYYLCTSNNYNKVLDVSGGSKANGANVQLYSTNKSAAQKIKLVNNSDGTVCLYTFGGSGNMVLDAAGGKAANGTNVWSYSYNGTKAQKWKLTKDGNTYKIASSINSNFVLDISAGSTTDGANCQLYSSNNSGAQRFVLLALSPSVEASTYTVEDSAIFGIQSAANSKFFVDLDAGKTANGTNIHLWQGTLDANNNQMFKFTSDGEGFYTITNYKTGKALDVSGANIFPGTNVQQYECNGTNAQKWSLQTNTDGSVKIINKGTGLVLDISGGTLANNSNIQGYLDNSTKAQKWKISKCDVPAVITFNLNGGSTSSGKSTFSTTYGKTYGDFVFDEPYKSGYVFDYWSANGAGGTAINPDDKIPYTVTLTANYKADKTAAQYVSSMNATQPGLANTYEVDFPTYDYGYVTANSNKTEDSTQSEILSNFGCSTVSSGNYFGRNFDMYDSYENSCKTYVVHTPATSTRHATVGIAVSGLTNPTSTSSISLIKQLPFTLWDGMNDAGLVCSVNALNSEDIGSNPGTDPNCSAADNTGKLREDYVVRFVLDYASTVEEAVKLLSSKDIYSFSAAGYSEFHYQLADATGKTAVIEFTWADSSKTSKVMKVYYKGTSAFNGINTNFTFVGYDGTDASLQNRGWGVERYNILNDALYGSSPTTISSTDDMLNLMKSVYSSQETNSDWFYDGSTSFWWSDFYWGNVTKNTEKTIVNFQSHYNYIKNSAPEKTQHSAAYDLANKCLKIIKCEDTSKVVSFKLAR